MKGSPRFHKKQDTYFVPNGGLDMVTSGLQLKSGLCIDLQNYECDLVDGITRIAGYDRYHSGLTPNELDIQVISLSTFNGPIHPAPGMLITGQTSGAVMTFIGAANPEFDTGDQAYWLRVNALNQGVYVAGVAGTFEPEETLLFDAASGPLSFAVLATAPVDPAGNTDAERAEAKAKGMDIARATMGKPRYDHLTSTSGAIGPVLGVVEYKGDTYCWRAQNPGGSTLGAIDPNATLVMLKAEPGAAGEPDNRQWKRLFGMPSRLAAGVKMDFVVNNFTGHGNGDILYFTTGNGHCLAYDGAAFADVLTGNATFPHLVEVHKNRLWLAFENTVEFSSPGDPLNTGAWSATVGTAGFYALADQVTAMQSMTGGENSSSLLVSTTEEIQMIYGDSEADFDLKPYSPETGIYPYSIQKVGSKTIGMNAFGLTDMRASDQYGGFEDSTFSDQMKPFIDERRDNVVASMVVRTKNQYRLFFDDGTAVYVTFRDGKMIGMAPQLFPHQITCAWSSMLPDRTELLLIGTEDGEVYRMDVGSSFAGETIEHFARPAFNHARSPYMVKHYKRAEVEIQSTGFTQFEAGYDLDYGGSERAVTPNKLTENTERNATWDQGNWDHFNWDGAQTEPVVVDTPGSGRNFALRIQGNDRITQPFTIAGVISDFTMRRKSRGRYG